MSSLDDMPTTSRHPIGTPAGLSPNTGPLASAAWLVARDLRPDDAKWFVELVFLAPDARFELAIYAEEWGFRFERAERVSWVRVTDIAFVHGRDDHQLLGRIPPLREIARLVRALEAEHGIRFARDAVRVTTSIPDADSVLQTWASTL
jgi:hypothetical protein